MAYLGRTHGRSAFFVPRNGKGDVDRCDFQHKLQELQKKVKYF